MIIKENEYQGLQEFDVLIEDSNPNSDYFQVTEFPETIPGGKSFFKISAAAGLLRPESEIRVEVLDESGQVIYTEYPEFIDESDRRLISIFVYDFIPPGLATVTILGEAQTFLDGSPIPIDFVGSFNVRWQRTLNVEPFKKNNFPIFFEKEPSIQVTEVVKPYLEIVKPSGSSVTTVGTSNNSSFKISLETRQGNFFLVSKGGFKFESEMLNSAVTFSAITNPKFNQKSFPTVFGQGPETFTIDGVVTPYYANIQDIINDSRVQVKNPFELKTEFSKTGNKQNEFDRDLTERLQDTADFTFDDSEFSISFRKKPDFTPTQNLRSFAKINLNDINTISGDVHHIKTFMKSQGSVGGFELVNETVLEASELLIDENSIDLQEPIGQFFSQTIIDNNWSVSSSNTAVNEFTASRETSNLNNSVFISGSFRNHSGSVTFTPQASINFATNGDYELSFKSFVDSDENSVDDGHDVDIYLTGSSFFSSSGYLEPYGLKIGNLNSTGSKYFGKSDIDFTTSETGAGNILFHVKRGLWRFSDISIRSTKETGFSPATTTLYIPVPTEAQDDVLDFEFKFYDNDNNEASASFQKLDNDFAGGNTFIGGGSNLVTGSVFIGNSTGSGMEFAGINSAFMRSVGYDGFVSASAGSGRPGFMFYSGSVLPGSGDDYNGVGFELNDGASGSLQFRTDTGVFNVKTPSFFLGSDNQFVSGALGNVEISSSNFHLQPDGDVLMQGTITATEGEIGGYTIGATKLENIHDLGSNAYVSMSLSNGAVARITMERGDSDTPDNYSRISHLVNASSAQFALESRESTGPTVQATQAMIATNSSTRLVMKAQSGSVDNHIEIKNDPKGEGTVIFTGANGQGFGNYKGITRSSGNVGFLLQVSQSAPATSAVHFFVGRDTITDAGGFIHYNGDAGTLEMRAPSFFLGGSSQFISGSGGLMEISSSNFHISSSGDVTMAGEITANSGEIGGWAISSTAISKDGVELNSEESGFRVTNPSGREVVYVGSRSLQEVTGSAVTSSFNGSFELANVSSTEGAGAVVSQSNQISGWNLQYTGSAGSLKIENGSTYPSASVIAVDGNNAIIVVNAAGVAI